jgi:parallel beta-helix repeat protein
MNKRQLITAVVAVVLVGFSVLSVKVQISRAAGSTIYINSDGSFSPSDAPIQRAGNRYTLNGNITSDADGIVIQKDSVTLDGAGFTIQGSEQSESRGIDVSGKSNVAIKNTNIRGFQYGINLYSVSKCTVTGNNVTNNRAPDGGMGIKMRISSNCTISDNVILNNTYSNVWIFTSHDIILTRNILSHSFYGIFAYNGCTNDTVNENTISSNFYGIGFDDVTFCVISRNNMTDNNRTISFSLCFNNTIFQNNIINSSEYGVEFFTSSNNTFHSNNFLDNTHQIYMTSSANLWNQSYPLGGNYWSDYTGTDQCKGPNQDQNGTDNIGDTPYTIGSDADGYPLMVPWLPSANPLPSPFDFTLYAVAIAIVVVSVSALAVAKWKLRKGKHV